MTWQEIRKEILERDNFTCQECYTKTNKLDVHHMMPRKQGGQDTFRNLISVCYKCHQSVECRYLEPLFPK